MLQHIAKWIGSFAVAAGLLGLVIDVVPGPRRSTLTADLVAASSVTPLRGVIRSATGEPLEGVPVSARPVGKTYTVSVFSDEKGEYVFPPLDAPFERGQYKVWAQAVGYDRADTELALDGTHSARHEFVLRTIKDFTAQLSGAEWLDALPTATRADRRMKEIFRVNCTECHQAGLVFQNRFDEPGWLAVIEVMERATYHGSGAPTASGSPMIGRHKAELAKYLARVSGPGSSPMNFKLQPRPRGEAARHVVTEFDIPIAELPDELVTTDGSRWTEGIPSGMVGGGGMHDVAIDNNGNAWITDSVRNKFRTLAKLDVKTGQVTGYKLAEPNGTFARSSHGIYKDRKGILWFDTGGSLGRLDPATETFEMFTPPPPLRVGGSLEEDGKGKIWLPSRHGALQFDPDTKKFRYFQNKTIGDGNSYGVAGDALGNGWWAQFNQDIVGHANAATGKVDEVRMSPPWTLNDESRLEFLTQEDEEFHHNAGIGTFTGTFARPGAQAPRRLSSEPNGNYVWVANWWGNNLARINIRTLEPTYYKLPFNTHPYATVVDRNGMVWTNLSSDDAVARFNPKTEQWTVFKLPTLGAELRYITVHNAGGPDVWVVYREASKATRIQFRTEEQIQALNAAN